VHAVGAPATHAPAWQVSPVVQALLSVHVVPLGAGGFEQRPVSGSQTPARWHWSLAAHTVGIPVHTPPWQVSLVQALPSLHAVPLGTGGFEQRPVTGSQTPAR
jgi:hypothetical protein